ncbi:MAG: hypothetical protein Q9170_003033 [Blastenia crenularia]
MSSDSSSDGSQSEDDVQLAQRKRLTSTPRTPLSPQEPFPAIEESKTHRSSSFVRFQGLKATEDEDLSLNRKPPRSPAILPTNPEEDDGSKSASQNQLNIQLLDKIQSLENQFHNLELSQRSSSWEKGDESSERTGLSTEIQWMTWQEYLEDASKASNILEVLIEKPHTNSRRRSAMAQPILDNPQRISTKTSANPHKNIERIRIRSAHIISALQTITEQTFSHSSRLIIHRPFKVLLFYREQILDYLVELEHDFAENTQCALGKQCKGYVKLDEDSVRLQSPRRMRSGSHRKTSVDESTHEFADSKPSPRRDDDECRHELSEELLAQVEAITHLRILTKFMKEDMDEIFAKHELLRSSMAEKIAFQDMWHLFMAGDLVVAESESSERSLELYQVSVLPAADFFSSRRPVKQISTRTEGSQHLVESVYKEESVSAMSVFTVDVFYFDFDGQKYGPVEKRMHLNSYEGEKNILDLPLYPLRFRKDADQFKAMMLGRGMKFRELSIPNQYPHREYSGLSVGEPQEQSSLQIDSQVIIDFALAYRKHPKNAPKFGLRSWIEDDARIVTEACGIPGCTDCFKDRFMFDDHRVDRQRTVEFIRANQDLLRIITDVKELTQNIMLLLPNKIYGFILRSRRWHFLSIDNVRPLERHSDGFENLILPPGVARLVESLVRTHDPQNMPSFTDSECEPEHHVDLVRGKGKGLVVLLHGAPGVGKTSTAECVADYTHRPLFPITCGDIGETSKEVEYNLEQNFSLAHRWGCVLLLDEADVFLQARDRENMRRNSVVSVFLRVLEFYSGILFLTTNKVGHFDEAFKSRIHVSLYYPALNKRSTLRIWKMNLDRLGKSKKALEVEGEEIYEYARKHFRELYKKGKTTWNGRQIKNAFQTAIALAEFDANERGGRPVLGLEHFKVVAQASEDFDDYLFRVHGGNEADLAKRFLQRDDDSVDGRGQTLAYSMGGMKGGIRKQESSTSSESDDSDAKEKKKRKKDKKQKKKGGRGKTVIQASESESSSSGTE